MERRCDRGRGARLGALFGGFEWHVSSNPSRHSGVAFLFKPKVLLRYVEAELSPHVCAGEHLCFVTSTAGNVPILGRFTQTTSFLK